MDKLYIFQDGYNESANSINGGIEGRIIHMDKAICAFNLSPSFHNKNLICIGYVDIKPLEINK